MTLNNLYSTELRSGLLGYTCMFVVAYVQPVLDGLLAKNHTISNDMSALAVVESIRSRCHLTSSFASDDNCIEAVSDGRKGGTPAGF